MAVLPGTGRDAAFRLHKESGPGGFAVETGNGGEPVGTLALSEETMAAVRRYSHLSFLIGLPCFMSQGRSSKPSVSDFDERLIEALHVVERLVRSPEALANVLEAAGQLTLERPGALLDERIPGRAEWSGPSVPR